MARSRESLPTAAAGKMPAGVRPLLVQALDGGGWAVLAGAGLLVVTEDELVLHRPWSDVDHGDWDGEANAMTLTWVDGAAPTRLDLTEDVPARFPLLIREQVEHSLVQVITEKAAGGGQLRAAIRRGPDGELFSQVTSSGKVRRGPALEAQIADLEKRIRTAVGLHA
ncbi:hypothetical protein EXU48_18895 [Occultella glacieicola]|uniref:Uncharacterized protein n=1 Tax=Occultella glacieicola TaxID=2518684 RepID=A0ABY2DZ77_9MICO|nr:hypothetical protein [Occultella glacieicola]TDE89993.1 hypothetical protein EXU48_18895 [Occultella glacieicola]